MLCTGLGVADEWVGRKDGQGRWQEVHCHSFGLVFGEKDNDVTAKDNVSNNRSRREELGPLAVVPSRVQTVTSRAAVRVHGRWAFDPISNRSQNCMQWVVKEMPLSVDVHARETGLEASEHED